MIRKLVRLSKYYKFLKRLVPAANVSSYIKELDEITLSGFLRFVLVLTLAQCQCDNKEMQMLNIEVGIKTHIHNINECKRFIHKLILIVFTCSFRKDKNPLFIPFQSLRTVFIFSKHVHKLRSHFFPVISASV